MLISTTRMENDAGSGQILGRVDIDQRPSIDKLKERIGNLEPEFDIRKLVNSLMLKHLK